MSKIVFFSIAAHGHTNPTIPVVEQLVTLGHEVTYFSFLEFKEKIESAGAKFIACDKFLPQISEEELNRKAGKDFAALIEMVVETTIAMDEKVCEELKRIQPDCIVSDSFAYWGRLFAKKLNILYICSTTSFAFNQHTAKLMKPSFKEMVKMIFGMRRVNKKIQQLNSYGYEVDNFLSIIQNDNDTDTIVYTSRTFQPMIDTFSDKFSFVGPSIMESKLIQNPDKSRKLIYVSLGTVLNQNKDFYKNCIKAFTKSEYEVVMSVGDKTDITTLGPIPDHITVKKRVKQTELLQKADVFITHCGMNSVNESLYFGVPMVLFPLHSEQMLVASRAEELGAGLKLNGTKPEDLLNAVENVLGNSSFKKSAEKLSEDFQNAGGAKKAADVILAKINQSLTNEL